GGVVFAIEEDLESPPLETAGQCIRIGHAINPGVRDEEVVPEDRIHGATPEGAALSVIDARCRTFGLLVLGISAIGGPWRSSARHWHWPGLRHNRRNCKVMDSTQCENIFSAHFPTM